jgi:Golgi nucleoside diphosphatase
VGDDENDREDDDDGFDATKSSSSWSSSKVQCVRRGSSRADIPLSAFGRLPSEQTNNNPLDPTKVATHLLPLFEYAANIIPTEYYETTGVYYQATAGMRLLEESEQEAVYDAVYEGLVRDESFVFRGIQREDIATLSGEMEAYYGALAANFLRGIIDTELRVVSAHKNNRIESPEAHHNHPVGALDMGGSSTQIVYIANQEDDETEVSISTPPGSTMCPVKQQQQQTPLSNNDNNEDESQNTCRLSDEHFFSTSYLSYGVDQIRKRLWDTLVAEQIASESEETCDHKYISNPCANKGFEVEYSGYTLLGSGNTEECSRQMKRLIPHPDIVHEWDSDVDGWAVGGVEHPPIKGKFLAMSLYFFALDSLRVFSEPHQHAHKVLDEAWPNPSIEELQNALDGLCSRDWHGDMELQEGVHSFTRKEVLPHRCLETVYMVTLLRDGFGFHPSSRDITFAFLIDGDEVEWTLGMALAMNANERSTTATTTVTTTTYDYNINETGNSVFEEERQQQQEQEQYLQRVSSSQFFSVMMPPTHCC